MSKQDDDDRTKWPAGRGVTKHAKDDYRISLPGGGWVSVQEWLTADFYSALIVDPRAIGERFRLFGYGRGQLVEGSRSMDGVHAVAATLAYTNVPRSGSSGLPQEWEAYVTSWRAHTSARLDDDFLAWAEVT